jgi:hypothetical protein
VPIGILFWILMLLWLVFGFFWNRQEFKNGNYGFFGGNILLFVLLVLIGWQAFGAPLR